MKDSLQHSRNKGYVQHHLHSPEVFCVQDAKGRQLVRSRQQDQGICKSTCLFGGTREREMHCHDFAR